MTSEGPNTRQKGQFELHIESVWANAWDAYNAGQSYEFYLAQSEADITRWRSRISAGDLAAEQELQFAEIYDRAQRQHFIALLKDRNEQKSKLTSLYEMLLGQVMRQQHFVMQSLALAHGSAVLATVTYIGRDGAGSVSIWLVAVLAFGGLGFLLVLAMAQLGILRAQRPLAIIMGLAAPRISAEQIDTLNSELVTRAKRSFRISLAMGIVSAVLLASELIAGTIGVLNSTQ